MGRPRGDRRLGFECPREAAAKEPHPRSPGPGVRLRPCGEGSRSARGRTGVRVAAPGPHRWGGREGWAPPVRGGRGPRGRFPRGGSPAPPRRSGFLSRPPAAGCGAASLPPTAGPSLRPLPASPPPGPPPAFSLRFPSSLRRSPQPRGAREDGGGGRRRRRGGRGPGRRGGAGAGVGVGAARAWPLRWRERGRPGPRAQRAAPRGGRRAAAADAPGAEQPQENPGEKPAPGQQLPGTKTALGGDPSRGHRGRAPVGSCPEASRLMPGALERSRGRGGSVRS